MALLVVSGVLLGWTLLLSAALVGLGSHRAMVLMWAAAAGPTALWLLLSTADVVTSTAIGAAVSPVAACALAIPAIWALTSDNGSARAAARG